MPNDSDPLYDELADSMIVALKAMISILGQLQESIDAERAGVAEAKMAIECKYAAIEPHKWN